MMMDLNRFHALAVALDARQLQGSLAHCSFFAYNIEK